MQHRGCTKRLALHDLPAKQHELLFRLRPKVIQHAVDQRNIATETRNNRRFRFNQGLGNIFRSGRRLIGCLIGRDREREFFSINLSVQDRHQTLDIDRFAHMIIHAGIKTCLPIGVRCIRRHRDNG